MFYYKQFFSHYDVEKLLDEGLAVYGVNGGLLLGHSHAESGIPVLVEYAEGYRLMAEFEGNEYWVSSAGTYQFSEYLHNINNPKNDWEEIFYLVEMAETISILDCRLNQPSRYKSKFLIHRAGENQFIVNKHSTKKHLRLLDYLNSSLRFKSRSALVEWDKYRDHDPFAVPRDWKPSNRLPLDSFDNNFIRELQSVPYKR